MQLSVIAVPIGHPEDITLRAIETLKEADIIICEETKIGRKLIRRLGIQLDPYELNEHNEKEAAEDIMEFITMIKSGKKAALISDAGTPLFADPGLHLVQACHQAKIPVIPVPGASSLTAALSVAGVNVDQFIYAGFLPRSVEERQKALQSFHPLRMPVVLYDTPYRLGALLADIAEVFSKEQRISLMMALTQEDEEIFKGTVGQMLKRLEEGKIKKEFVMILEARERVHYAKDKKGDGHKKKVKTRKRR